jgi:hypothetical protein
MMPGMSGSAPRRYLKVYDQFKGVDLTTNAFEIAAYRSPSAPNMVSDQGGNPEKRVGWRTLANLEAPVNGIFATSIAGTPFALIHAATTLYTWDFENDPVQVTTGLNNARSAAFSMNDRCWILDGQEYWVFGAFDGAQQLKRVADIAYIPTTTIARLPSGGGSAYEAVNLLSPKRKNTFIGNGTAVEYQLDAAPLDDSSPLVITVDGSTKTEGTDYTVDRTMGKITFVTAPPAPQVVGQANVIVEFSKTVSDYYSRIARCTITTTYGVGSNDRCFMSGNPDEPAQDWHCELLKPEYMPDINYSVVGSQSTAIMGYLKIGEQLAIIKEDRTNDSTIFLRTGTLNTDQTKALFPLKQGVTGVGAISRNGFGYLADEPLFISRRGIYALTSNLINAERSVQNRSFYIDPALTLESGLESAVACEWSGLFLVAIPGSGKMYVLDGRQPKQYRQNSNYEYAYEAYHWLNIPASVMLSYRDAVFFGTSDGRVCRFNNDLPGTTKYNDDGQPIAASWATPADHDGYAGNYKTMYKRGGVVVIKPFTRSSIRVAIRTEHDREDVDLTLMDADIFSWSLIDFARFTFFSEAVPKIVPFNRKVKKYITLQFILSNDALNEGFGVYRLEKTYVINGYVK